ncbi:MAG: ABC transporter permease [Dehalococcoidia bacterium]
MSILTTPPTGSRNLARLVGEWAPALAIGLVAIAIWEFAVRIFDVQRWLLPAPSVIAGEIGASWALLMRHAAITGQEVVIGFLVAAVAGVALATAITLSRLLERSIYPFVIASQTIPIITIAPLLLVWIGPDITSKVIVVALISFFPIVVNLVDGLRATDREMADMLRTLGASRMQVFMKLKVPMALPYLFSGLKIAAVVAVIGAVIGEWVGAQGGLGWLMRVSAPQFQTARVFASIVVLSAMAVSLFLVVAAVERWALRNYPRATGQGSD